MAYTETEWVNDSEPAINADNLNNMETGIAASHDHIALTDNPHTVTLEQVGAAASDHNHDGDYSPIGAATTSTKIDDFAAPDDNTDLNATTSAHGLCPKGDNNTDHFLRGDMSWETPSGGSTKEYASFYLSTGGITGVAASETTLTLNATSVNSDTDIFELASSQVTVNKSADFEISAQCYFNTGGSSRSEYTMFLEVDGVEVPGTRTGTYQRGYDSGDTASFSIMLAVTSGEVFQLRIIRTDGSATTGYQDDNGTRLSFKEL
jgi:hypothetical protein